MYYQQRRLLLRRLRVKTLLQQITVQRGQRRQ